MHFSDKKYKIDKIEEEKKKRKKKIIGPRRIAVYCNEMLLNEKRTVDDNRITMYETRSSFSFFKQFDKRRSVSEREIENSFIAITTIFNYHTMLLRKYLENTEG